MDNLLKKLGIDEKFTKAIKQPRKFNKVKDNIPLKQDYNFMANLLFLPETSSGYKYLLVMVDLANDEFDIEEIRNKESATVLSAMKNIFKRGILKKPYASIRTDSGSEFKGIFHKYLYDANILHKIALPNRHTQLANVEALNRQLGRLLNGYMNQKELETGKVFKSWKKILGVIRRDLNIIRKKKLPTVKEEETYLYPIFDPTYKIKTKKGIKLKRLLPKFQINDLVHRLLDYPKNALGKKQSGTFRMGDFRYDVNPQKITRILYYAGDIPYRYMIEGIDNASFKDTQLMKAYI